LYLAEFILVFSFGFQILIWINFFSARLSRNSKEMESVPFSVLPVSVLICAHNACSQLAKLIPLIMRQRYPLFELVLVNDGSSDQTTMYVQELQKSWPNLRLVDHQKSGPGKKSALIQGLSQCRYELILLTDADCYPAGDYWIQTMVRCLNKNGDIVLGYSPYYRKTGILNRFIRFETCLNGIQYISCAIKGFPYMGVGRNLLYRKAIFDPVLFIPDIIFGDDDLLVNNLSSSATIYACSDPGSFVYSEPKSGWKEYFHQRRRHFAASTSYRIVHKLFLGSYHLSFLFSYLCLPFLFINPHFPWLFGLFLVRLACVWFIFARSARKLGESDLIAWFPFLEIMYLLWLLVHSFYLRRRPKNW